MNSKFSRRKLITGGLASIAGVASLEIASKIADRYGLLAPDHSGLFGVGEAITYGAQRILTARGSMAREFSRGEISKVSPVNHGGSGLRPLSKDDVQ